MSVCKYCGTIGGYHVFGCPAPHAAREYRGFEMQRPSAHEPEQYRVEWFGSLQVHQPVKP